MASTGIIVSLWDIRARAFMDTDIASGSKGLTQSRKGAKEFGKIFGSSRLCVRMGVFIK
jgi:hypothetical protein